MKFYDRVKETTSIAGSGDIVLGGTSDSYQAFNSVFSINDLVPYCVVGTTEWEVGQGILVSGTVLRRSIVHDSSQSKNAVNFTAGSKDVFCTIPGFFTSRVLSRGSITAKFLGYDMP